MIDALNNGLGEMRTPMEAAEIAGAAWNLLAEDLSLPVAVLYEDKLVHNLDWMRRFVSAYQVHLCPHGKTTMAPKLFHRQLDGGAWGITLATAPQVRAAYEHGVRRVIMANQLVGRQNMAIISRLIEDPGFEFYCLVDSVSNLDQLGLFFSKRGQTLNILLEVGVSGGRSGVRNQDQVDAILQAQTKWQDHISICGVELFEGVLNDESDVRCFLSRAIEIASGLADAQRFARSPFILSGAGSAWFDVVADMFTSAQFSQPVEIVLRPGCYLTHDVGIYAEPQKRMTADNVTVQGLGPGLLPALHVWAYVQSLPEDGLAIVGMGKRDVSFDAGMPEPALTFRPGSKWPGAAPKDWQVFKMMDQHSMLRVPSGSDIRVGDMIGFDISHPCLTFDKWRCLPILNEEFTVIDIAETFF